MTLAARFSGVCPDCGQRWQPGDFIRAEADQVWRHAVCPDDVIEALIICDVCRLTHPIGACDR